MTIERRFFKPPPSEVIAKAEATSPTEIYSAKDDKDAKMDLALERLDQGVEKLLEDPAGYFKTMAKFTKFSLMNQLMIWAQDPEATMVAGYRQWNEKFNRQVQKGEKAIRIFYPRFKKAIDEDTGEIVDKLVGFGLGSVFDARQTEGDPLPEPPEVTNDVSTSDIATAINLKLSRWAIDQGLTMESVPLHGHRQGDYSPKDKRIRIRLSTAVSPFSVGKTKTLAHEVSHYVAGHEGDIDRRDAEVVAESSAFVVMSHYGLDTQLYSANYIAGWGEERERLHQNLAEIRRVSGTIIDAVDGVGDPYSDDFGSFDNAGPGPVELELMRQEEEWDKHAPNI